MADNNTKAEQARLKNEKKKLKADQKKNAADAKKRAKEIAKQERKLESEQEGSGFSVFIITVFIILVWLIIIGILIKLDVGHFGSEILRPLIGDNQYLSWILPSESNTEGDNTEIYDGYSDLRTAVEQIKALELELAQAQAANRTYEDTISSLKARIAALEIYEEDAAELEKQKNLFYEEVIYADNAPSIEEYAKWYELMEPENAEYWYKRVIAQIEEDEEFEAYAQTFANMKPKEAAALFESMGDNLELAAKILMTIDSDSRAKILDAMDKELAAKLAKLMNPES